MELGRGILQSLLPRAKCDGGGSLEVLTTPGSGGGESSESSGDKAKAAQSNQPQPLAEAYSSPPDPLDQYAAYIVRGSVIGVGLAGAAIFARSIRLFTRFQHARDIPEDFIRKGVRLQGRVSTVEPDGTLRVAHKPLASLPSIFASRRGLVPGLLSVRLAGIELNPEGATFLRQRLGSEFGGNGRRVWFSLIHRPPMGGEGKDRVECEVTAKLGRPGILSYNLNQEMVRRGLARVPSTGVPEHLSLLRSSPAYARLVNQLLISERIADRRGVGMWRRETWVEGAAALPSQLATMATNTSLWRLAVMLGIGLRSTAVTVTRVGLWTARKTPEAVRGVAAGTGKVIQGGTTALTVAKEGGEKALVVTQGFWRRLVHLFNRLAEIYRGIRRRLGGGATKP